MQRDLYNMMADLATLPETATRPPWLAEPSAWPGWSSSTDALGAGVEMPKAFIVPGDSVGGAALEIARTVVRRAERLVARLATKASCATTPRSNTSTGSRRCCSSWRGWRIGRREWSSSRWPRASKT